MPGRQRLSGAIMPASPRRRPRRGVAHPQAQEPDRAEPAGLGRRHEPGSASDRDGVFAEQGRFRCGEAVCPHAVGSDQSHHCQVGGSDDRGLVQQTDRALATGAGGFHLLIHFTSSVNHKETVMVQQLPTWASDNDGRIHVATQAPSPSNHRLVPIMTLGLTLWLVVSILLPGAAQTPTVTDLYTFSAPNGAAPLAGLIQGTDGNLYGTTYNGGTGGFGTVFKITTSGTLTSLYSFSGSDGANPRAGLIQATDGNLYGTTTGGGAGNNGTVFKITTSGTLTSLYSFSGSDGADPWASLIQATDGNLYGTTRHGGASGYGTVFKITTAGTLTTLHSFTDIDGAYPAAALIQATDGNLYGTTIGQPHPSGWGYGTVFKITTSGTL